MSEDWVTKGIREQRELRKLMEVAAQQVLRPRKVKVRFQETATGMESGSVSRDIAGTYIIDISPSTPIEHQYEILLHECGHVLDTSHEILKTNYHTIPPGSVPFQWGSGLKSAQREHLEQRAGDISAQLKDYAERHAPEYWNASETYVHSCLRALCHAKVEEDEVRKWYQAQLRLRDKYTEVFSKRKTK